jgi:hypothetical protein
MSEVKLVSIKKGIFKAQSLVGCAHIASITTTRSGMKHWEIVKENHHFMSP